MKKTTRPGDARDRRDNREPTKPEATKQSEPQARFNKLPNEHVEMCVSFGEFGSKPEAEQAAKQIMHDLNLLGALDQVEYEITHGQDLGDETLEQMLETDLREQCDRIAASLGMTELWQQSQKFPNFQKAWTKWRAAWNNWLGGNRRFPETKGPNRTRYLWMQKQFLAGVRSGLGNEHDFYRNHSLLLFYAARRGDVEFFKRFAQAKRGEIKPGKVDDCLMITWMPAALWSATDVAQSNFILKQFHLRHGTKGSVRTAWHNLNLWHSPKPIIRGWQFPNKENQLSHPKALFYPNRRPKV
jgi:hypothetical protein